MKSIHTKYISDQNKQYLFLKSKALSKQKNLIEKNTTYSIKNM